MNDRIDENNQQLPSSESHLENDLDFVQQSPQEVQSEQQSDKEFKSELQPAKTMKTNLQDEMYLVFAGFWVRFWAYMIDLIVVGSLNRIVVKPVLRLLDIPVEKTSMVSLYAFLTAVILYAYFIIMTKLFGQTLGKMIFGLRVIQEDQQPLKWSTVVFRELVGKFISETVFFLGFVTVGFTKKKKGWHDMIADTVVIQERKGVLFTAPLKPSLK